MLAILRPISGFSLLLMFASVALAVAADDPAAPPDASSAADPFGGHEWALTPYLKGTAPEIRDKLNGEAERLILRIKESQETIRQSKIDSQNDEKAALEAMKKSAVYRQAAADKTKAEADLESARKGGSAQDRLDASSRFNKARLELEKLEHDAVANCSELSQDRHRLFDAEKNLKRYHESLDKAVAWREELLDATRNGFMLKGPIADGSKGTLPRVTIEKIVDGDQVQVEFDLITFDMEHPGKDKEGIKSFPATKSRIHVLVSGVDTSAMKAGDKMSLDRVFVVDGTKTDEKDGTQYLARPFRSDADKLFEMIVPLRESLPGNTGKP